MPSTWAPVTKEPFVAGNTELSYSELIDSISNNLDTSTAAFALDIVKLLGAPEANTEKVNMEEVMKKAVTDWITVTHRVMDYREIEALNHYIADVQFEEDKRLTNNHVAMRNNIMVTKQMFLMQNRDSRRLKSRARMLMFTILFICLMFSLAPSVGSTPVKAAMGVTTAAYIGVLLMFVKINSTRRMDDWNKHYFRSGDLDTTTTSADAILNIVNDENSCTAESGTIQTGTT